MTVSTAADESLMQRKKRVSGIQGLGEYRFGESHEVDHGSESSNDARDKQRDLEGVNGAVGAAIAGVGFLPIFVSDGE